MKEVQLLTNKAEESQGGWQGVLKAATSGVAYLLCGNPRTSWKHLDFPGADAEAQKN